MKIRITSHPRLPTAAELLIMNGDGEVVDSASFAMPTVEKSVEEAKLYAETMYPNIKIEVKDVQLSDGN